MFCGTLLCSLAVLMRSGPPSLSHTAVPVLLISPNNHFNSISRKHQPPHQHQNSQLGRIHTRARTYTDMHLHMYRIHTYIYTHVSLNLHG